MGHLKGRVLRIVLAIALVCAASPVATTVRPAKAASVDVQSMLDTLASLSHLYGSPQLQITVRDLDTGTQWSVNGDQTMGYWSSFKWWAVAHTASVVGYDNIPASWIQGIFGWSDNTLAGNVVDLGGGINALNRWTQAIGMSSTCQATWYGRIANPPCPEGRNLSTSNDAVEFLSRLWHGQLLSPADTRKVLDAALLTPDTGEYHDSEPLSVRRGLRHKAGYVPTFPWRGNSTIAIYDLPQRRYAMAVSMAGSTAGMVTQEYYTEVVGCYVYRVMADPSWDCTTLAHTGPSIAAYAWPASNPAAAATDRVGVDAVPVVAPAGGDLIVTMAVDVTNNAPTSARATTVLPCGFQEVTVPARGYHRFTCDVPVLPGQTTRQPWYADLTTTAGLWTGLVLGAFDVVGPRVGPTTGAMYGLDGTGQLRWYRHLAPVTGAFDWAVTNFGNPVGEGFGVFDRLVSGGRGLLYGVAPNGDLRWYRHTDPLGGSLWWTEANFGNVVGTGWGSILHIVPDGTGRIYTVTPDGTVRWYFHTGRDDGTFRWDLSSGTAIGSGFDACSTLFAGGPGILYCVRADGDLQWWRHVGSPGQLALWIGGDVVGSGWNQFTRVWSGGDGVLYAVDASGVLRWYRHLGFATGRYDWEISGFGGAVGSGWDIFTDVLTGGLRAG